MVPRNRDRGNEKPRGIPRIIKPDRGVIEEMQLSLVAMKNDRLNMKEMMEHLIGLRLLADTCVMNHID